jgi:hypothetical protein
MASNSSAHPIVDKIRNHPLYRPSDLLKDIVRDRLVKIPFKRTLQANGQAKAMIDGTDIISTYLITVDKSWKEMQKVLSFLNDIMVAINFDVYLFPTISQQRDLYPDTLSIIDLAVHI